MEVWKSIKGYEGLYEASSFGRIKSFQGKTERILKTGISKSNKKTPYLKYIAVLSKNKIKKSYPVSRIIGITFLENPEHKTQINHKDGNPLNNNVNNLEWCTAQENIDHAVSTGLMHRNSIKKLAMIDVEKALNMFYVDWMADEEIAKHFEIDRYELRLIFEKVGRVKRSEYYKPIIIKMRKSRMSQSAIGDALKIDKPTLSKWINHKYKKQKVKNPCRGLL